MNIRLITGAAAAVLVLTVATGIGFTEDAPKPKVEPYSEMELWPIVMKLGQPADMHKNVLAKFVGTWKADGKAITGMGEVPVNGTSTHTSLMDGRFVHVDFNGTFMGQPFIGGGHMGYDNLSKKFEQTWIMGISSKIDFMTGSWDAKTKTLTWKGTMDMPAKGGKVTYKQRVTYLFKSDDEIVREAFATGPDGKERKEMVLTYTKAKKAPVTTK